MNGGHREPGGRRARRASYARFLAILLAALVGLTSLWVANFDPAAWLRAATNRPATRVATPHPEAPVIAVQPRPGGTDSSVSKVSLSLHLVATRPGRNTRAGYADIGVDVRSPQTYRAGAILASGARIEEIYADYVVLLRGEERARLYVEGRAPAGYQPPSGATGMLTVGGASAHTEAVADSAEALTNFIRVTPVYDGTTLEGLQVYGNERSDVFARLGLEPGDVIHSIDGQPVRDPGAALTALRHLTEGQALMVEVERAGGIRALSLDGAIVVAARDP